MRPPEAQKLVTVLVTAFPSVMAKLDGDQQIQTMATYRRMLEDLDYAVANAAIERLLATAKFMPAPAEIREAALAITDGERSAGGDAWGTVLRAISRRGAYRLPGVDFEFRDPVIARCVAALGWRELCLSENQVADRARFIELYDQIATQERRKQLSEHLPAMQRYRALEAEQKRKLEARTGGESSEGAIGRVLALVAGGES